jgi:hypothetical protein
LALSEAPSAHLVPAVLSTTTTTTTTNPSAPVPSTTTTTRPHEVHIFPDPGSTPLPAFCAFGYPSNKYPPRKDPALDARLLTTADVPAGMVSYPPLYPTNGPGFDDFAVGYPKDPMTGITWAIPKETESPAISELLAQAPSPAAAAAQVSFAVEKVYGQCMQITADQPNETFPLPPSERSFVALKLMSGSSYNSNAIIVVFGAVGGFVFEVEVGNSVVYPDTGIAAYPTEAQVVEAVSAATAHLR